LSAGLAASVRRIAPLAWPVFVGQIAVLAFSTVDTLLVARHSPADLAAFAVGAAAYVTTFIGGMGIVVAVGPIVGQLFGAGRLHDAGRQLHQAVWIALAISVLGSTLLAFPAPFLALADAGPELAAKVRGYLMALALSLPASLLFTAYRGFNNAVSRPKAVMALQLGGLALKIPLSAALVFGVPAIGLPSLGVTGCGIATCIAVWAQVLVAWQVLRRDPFYDRFGITGRGLDAPDRRALWTQLRLGLPMGASILIEVSGFAFMAIFIARLGTTAVAGHQIAANLVALLFMAPLAIGNGTSTLVAQRIGARDLDDARRLGWHGLALGVALAALVAFCVVFHIADAAQAVAAFVLRAWRIATVPLVINAAALWGVGLGGGVVLGLETVGGVPPALRGAVGFWAASTAGLLLAAVALGGFLWWVQRFRRPAPAAPA
jgi:multidrug resistance protein, MATE family